MIWGIIFFFSQKMNAYGKKWNKQWQMFSQGIDMQKVKGVSPGDFVYTTKRKPKSSRLIQRTIKRKDRVLPPKRIHTTISNERYVQLPEHKRKDLINLYHAAKDKFHPEDMRERKRQFRDLIHLYYPYFSSLEYESAYMAIKSLEEAYMQNMKIIRLHGNYGKRIVNLFGVVDKDDSGSISIKEFKDAFKLYGLNMENIDDEFKKADKDANGKLDVMELFEFISSKKYIIDHFENVLAKCEDKKNRQIKEDKLLFFSRLPEENERPSLVHMKSLDEQIKKIRSSKIML